MWSHCIKMKRVVQSGEPLFYKYYCIETSHFTPTIHYTTTQTNQNALILALFRMDASQGRYDALWAQLTHGSGVFCRR